MLPRQWKDGGIEGKGDCKKVIEKEREWGREGKIKKDRRRW